MQDAHLTWSQSVAERWDLVVIVIHFSIWQLLLEHLDGCHLVPEWVHSFLFRCLRLSRHKQIHNTYMEIWHLSLRKFRFWTAASAGSGSSSVVSQARAYRVVRQLLVGSWEVFGWRWLLLHQMTESSTRLLFSSSRQALTPHNGGVVCIGGTSLLWGPMYCCPPCELVRNPGD